MLKSSLFLLIGAIALILGCASSLHTGVELEIPLEDQVQRWLSSPHETQIDRAQNRVLISSIFDWFGEDWQAHYAVDNQFVGNAKERAVLNFISNYKSAIDREYLAQGNYKRGYLDYDWSLNQQ